MRALAFVLLAALVAGCAKDPPGELDLVVTHAEGAEVIGVELANTGGSAVDVAATNFRLIAANGAVARDNYASLAARADRFPETMTIEPGQLVEGVLSFAFEEEATRPWTLTYKLGSSRVDAPVP